MTNPEPSLVNLYFPIVAVKVFEGGVIKVEREAEKPRAKLVAKGKRKKITVLSKSSLNKLAFTASVNAGKFKSLLTLTYGIQYPLDGEKMKRDLNRFLVKFRREFPALEYLWFLEFQARGAPHVHLLLSVVPKGVDKRNMSVMWCDAQKILSVPYSRISDHRLFHVKQSVFEFHKSGQRVWEVLRSKDGAKKYVVKYAFKTEQKHVPVAYRNVGRFWGSSRTLSNPKGLRIEIDEKSLRKYLDSEDHRVKDWDVLPKFIF